jgi:hypothetical protein
MSTFAINPLEITTSEYAPGVCNIGPAEISRRRKAGLIGLVITVAAGALLLALGLPAWWRLILFLPAYLGAVGYLQAYFHFCAGFGSRGVYNFDELGQAHWHKVADEASRAADKRKSLQISLISLLFGLAVALVAVALPLA